VRVALDTNVLVRLLVRDDEAQCAAARHLVEQSEASGEPVLLLIGAVLEAEWVLRSRYKIDKFRIIDAFAQLLESTGVVHEDEQTLEQALALWKNHAQADFTDCILAARALRLGCARLVTFDAGAARLPMTELLR
jgi:predicted nucleic-acid-binding protein